MNVTTVATDSNKHEIVLAGAIQNSKLGLTRTESVCGQLLGMIASTTMLDRD